MNFDDVLTKLGEFGKYQKIIFALVICIPGISCGIYMVISVFLLGIPKHRCVIPSYENDTYEVQSAYHQKLIDYYIPNTDPDDEDLIYDRCQIYSVTNFPQAIMTNYSHVNNSLVECTSWVYSDDIFDSTFAAQMDLVCQHKSKATLAKSMYFAGVLVGSLGLGILSDMIGRKKTLYFSFIVQLGSALGVAWAPSYAVYVTLRFFVGVSTIGVFMTGFVIAMELVGATKRMWAGVIQEYFFATGVVILAGVGYLLRDWFWIEIAVAIPGVIYLTFWWVAPESPRWLISQRRFEEVEIIVQKAAKVNKVTLPTEKLFDTEEQEKKTPGNLWHLFTSRVLFTRTLIIFFNWLVVSMTYYGLSLNSGNLGGDFYLNFFLTGLVEFPAYTLTILLLNRLGRKKLHCASMLLGGIACLCTIFTIVFGGKKLQALTTTLAMIGKLGSAAAFAIIYIFSAELYPTVVRNAGMGASSMCARIGGILAPYVAASGDMIGGSIGKAVPLVIFGGTSVVAGLLALILPETLGESLPETIEDGKIFGTEEFRQKSREKKSQKELEATTQL